MKFNIGRNVVSFLRKRVTYANVAMTLALVFAMTGGAFAAKHWVITSTKQIKPSVLKQLTGKRGPEGKQGPAGLEGKQGPAGPEGKPGKDGTNGTNGTNGVNGKSVTVAEVKVGDATSCNALGGASFEAEGSGKKFFACNGASGKEGKAGEPGKSVVTSPAGSECGSAGGTKFEVEGSGKPEFVCNGEGSNSTTKTFTGAWATGTQGEVLAKVTAAPETEEIETEVNGEVKKYNVVVRVGTVQEGSHPLSNVAISFPFEVSPAPIALMQFESGSTLAIEIENGKWSVQSTLWEEKCKGAFDKPTAEPGYLCIYVHEGKADVINAEESRLEAPHTFGVILPFATGSHDTGSWAVTA